MNSSNNKKEFRRKAILNDALLPLLVKTSIPTIIGMLVMVIYNLTDTFFVGILNNKSMTAAIGIVFSFMSFIQAIGFWFGYGSGNIMSKKIGENEEKEAEIISSIGILFAIVIGRVSKGNYYQHSVWSLFYYALQSIKTLWECERWNDRIIDRNDCQYGSGSCIDVWV